MTAAEVRAATAADPTAEYTEGDAGFKARVLRSDHAGIYQMMGRQYDPEWSYGFWRQKAKKNFKGEWSSDETPAQRGPRDVAERRAYKAALMKVFTPVPVNDYEESRRFGNLSSYVETETAVDTRLLADNTPIHRDEDGMLWASEGSASEGSYRTIDSDTGEITAAPTGNGHKAETVTPVTDGISNVQIKHLHALGKDFYGGDWDSNRHRLAKAISKGRTESSKDLTEEEADKLITGLQAKIYERESAAEEPDNPFLEEVPA
jgi:hypothetical protein